MGQKLAAFDAQGSIVAYYDTIDSPAPTTADTIEITDDQWRTCLATPGYTVQGGALVPPSPPTAAQLLAVSRAPLMAAARSALDVSDTTIVRCYEHAVAVPAEWQTYRAALRSIIDASSSATVLPTRPDYPAGT